MITDNGRTAFGNSLAEYLGGYVAVGVGPKAVAAGDTALDFEIVRVPVRTSNYNPVTGQLVFSATVPDYLESQIAEVGLVSESGELSNNVITAFDPLSEDWSGGSWTSNNVRIGSQGLYVSAATASTNGSSRVALSEIRRSDSIKVAFFGAGGSVTVRLNNTDADYYSFTFTAAAGYNVVTVPVDSLTVTGNADLSSVSGVTIVHSGSGGVTMDSIRVARAVGEGTLIVRQKFATPYPKVAGVPMDIDIPVVIAL